MKKKFLILLMLGALLLSLMLVGCDKAEPPKDTTTEPTTPGTVLIAQNNELITRLAFELLMPYASIEPIWGDTVASYIDGIKNGARPLHVDFGEGDRYFVCGYCNNEGTGSIGINELISEYIWVRFESEDEIAESYNGEAFRAAFQIDRAFLVADLRSADAEVPNVEHHQRYTPYFEDGVNSAPAMAIDKTLIYVSRNSENTETKYITFSGPFDCKYDTMPCIRFEDQYYLSVKLYVDRPNGNRAETNLAYKFGAYYDSLIAIMQTDTYSVTQDDGTVTTYGMIDLADFSNILIA